MSRSLYLIDLTSSLSPEKLITSTPSNLGEIFWLSDDKFAYLNQTDLYSSYLNGTTHHLLTFPLDVGDLQYHLDSNSVFFTAQIWEDKGGLEGVKEGDKAYADRGYDAEVFDSLFVR